MIKRILRKGSICGVQCLFWLLKRLPIKKNRVVLDSWKGGALRGNLLQIYKAILSHEPQIEVVVIGEQPHLEHTPCKLVKSKSLRHLYYLATSKYWIVDTLYYEYLKPRKETNFIMVWHAAGNFKKFGMSSVQGNKQATKIYKKLGNYMTHLVVSSKAVVPLYAKELAMNEEKIIPLGLPRTDTMVLKQEGIKEKIYRKYQIDPGKQLILYAPTFRGEGITPYENALDSVIFNEHFGEQYCLILKLHPNQYISQEHALGMERMIVSQGDLLEDLMKASDMMITDYSSSIFEYAVLGYPMMFFAYDLDDYRSKSRGFYVDYEKFVPGPIAHNMQELVEQLKNYNDECYKESRVKIADYYQLYDGACTKRFIKYFFEMDRRNEERSDL